METLGSRLRALREQRDLNQTELAKALGITSAAISAYELDKSIPRRDVLQRLADYFHVSIDYLLGRAEPVRSIIDTVDPAYVSDIQRQTGATAGEIIETLMDESVDEASLLSARRIIDAIRQTWPHKPSIHEFRQRRLFPQFDALTDQALEAYLQMIYGVVEGDKGKAESAQRSEYDDAIARVTALMERLSLLRNARLLHDSPLQRLAARIRDLRRSRNISPPMLAKMVGVSLATVLSWEAGIIDPPSGRLPALADALGVSIDYLLGRTDERRPAKASDEGPDYSKRTDLPPDLVEKINRIPPESRRIFLRAAGELSPEAWRSVIDYMLWRLEQDEKAKRESKSDAGDKP